MEQSQSGVLGHIPLVKEYLEKTATHIKSSPNGEPDEVNEWVGEVNRILVKVVAQLPKNRNLRNEENEKWLALLQEINTHITFCHDSIVTRGKDPHWKGKLAVIEAKIV